MVTRQRLALRWIGLVAIAVFVAAPDVARGAGRDVRFILDFMPDGFHSPFYVALDKGFYADEGLNVKISRGYGSGDTVKKLAAGQYDVGLAGVFALIPARANEGAAVKAIMLYLTRDMLTMWVRDEGKINQPRDLEAKTIATTPGNGHFIMFPAFAKGAGIDPTKVKWVTVDGAAMGPMLINKQIDAAPFFASHGPRIEAQAAQRGVKLKAFPYADYGLRIYSTSLIARDETIQKDGDMLGRFVRASLKGLRWAKDNVDDAARIVMKHNPEVTFEATKGAWEVSKHYIFVEEADKDGQGVFEPNRLRSTIEQIHAALQLKGMPSPDEVATNQFVPR
jgi:NitT/TauT family transport system substrate-binding protein